MKKFMMSTISRLLFLLLFFAFSSTIAQVKSQLTIINILNEKGEQIPARVRLTKKGVPVANSPQSGSKVMYGLWDHADGYEFQPDSSFYVGGSFSMHLAPGEYEIKVSKGFEYVDITERFSVGDGKNSSITITLKRWINMQERGWYSADAHIHIRRSPREDSLLAVWTKAENLNVGVFLKMGDFWATYYDQYKFGRDGVFRDGDFLLVPGQEDPRTPELGHALSFGAREFVRSSREYYLYDIIFDRIHTSGGLTGYAHQAQTFHGYRGLTLDGLRGKVDMLEVIQYCADENPLFTKYYYHLLDLGIPVTPGVVRNMTTVALSATHESAT
jgi:hypothetical protein